MNIILDFDNTEYGTIVFFNYIIHFLIYVIM